MNNLKVIEINPNIGAEVLGVDLGQPLSMEQQSAIEAAFAKHQVLFFRDQKLSNEQHLAFGRRFGTLHSHPLVRSRHAEHPELLRIHADENSKRVAGEGWHSDVTCEIEPPMGSILYLPEVPPSGGDTLFASMYAAYEALSPTMQKFLETLTAIHDGQKPWMKSHGGPEPGKTYPRAEHPVVTIHPATGRKILFVNRGFTVHIPQLSTDESAALLEFLYRHIETPEFQCRFRWQANSIAFWDNRCTQHHAIWDYFPHRRSGYRVTINGSRPAAAASALPKPFEAVM